MSSSLNKVVLATGVLCSCVLTSESFTTPAHSLPSQSSQRSTATPLTLRTPHRGSAQHGPTHRSLVRHRSSLKANSIETDWEEDESEGVPADGEADERWTDDKWMSIIKDFSKIDGGWQDVLVVVEEMRVASVPISLYIYHAAMQTCCNQGQAAKALELFNQMRYGVEGLGPDRKGPKNDGAFTTGPDKYCYDVAISACRRLGRRNEALGLLREMRSFGVQFAPSSYTYTEIFRACRGSPGGLQDADKLMVELLASQKAAGGTDAAPKSRKVCQSFLWLLADQGQWRRAINMLADMKEQGTYPDRACYSAANTACCKGGAWREATRLLDKQLFEAQTHPQVTPEESCYTQTIVACAAGAATKGPDQEEALARALVVLKQMRDAGFQGKAEDMVGVYQSLIRACVVDQRQWERALDLFSQMRKTLQGKIPGPVYRSVIHILSRTEGNRWKEAHMLLQEARSHGRNLTRVTYNSVIRMLGKGGELELAYDVFRQMRQASKGIKPGVDSYNQLLNGCAQAGEWRKAILLIEEMGQDGLPPDLYSYSAAIAALANAGEVDRALLFVARMVRLGPMPNLICYNIALKGCAKTGACERAQSLFQLMRQSGQAPDVFSFNSLIEAYGNAGQIDKAEEQLSLMTGLNVKPDQHTYGALLKAHATLKDWGSALRVLEDMRTAGSTPNAVCYTQAMVALAAEGRVDIAEQLLAQMTSEGVKPDVSVYTAAITVAARSSNMMGRAGPLLDSMRRAGLQPDLITYTALINAFGRGRAWERALELLQMAKVAGLKPNLYTYTAAMNACSKGGQYTRAMDLFDEMREAGIVLDAAAYCVAIDACEHSGNYQRAESLSAEMKKEGLVPVMIGHGESNMIYPREPAIVAPPQQQQAWQSQ